MPLGCTLRSTGVSASVGAAVLAGASAISVGTALFYDPFACTRIAEGIIDFLHEDAKRNALDRPRPLRDYVGTLALNS